MTAEQLEKLLGKVTQGGWQVREASHGPVDVVREDGSDILTIYGTNNLANGTLIAIAPSLARKVIAAERLAEATEALSREMAFILRHNPEKDGGLYRATLDAAVSAATAYREASK